MGALKLGRKAGDRATRKYFLVGVSSAFFVTLAPPATAEGISLNGFVQSHVAARTSRVDCADGTECDFPAIDLRGELAAEGKDAAGNAGFLGRFDLLRDIALAETRLETRELYGDLNSEKLVARLGRQVITWGVGDLLFINDTFPKDPVALFTGQPLQNFKLGSDALKLNAYTAPANLEIVIAGFRPDNTPTGRRFVLPDPFPAGLPRRIEEPGNSVGELEVSARAYRYLDNWELSGYASHTHFHTQARRVIAGEVVGTYPRLNTVGASLTGSALKGVFGLEMGYYESVQDREGRDPSIDNSQFRGLIGYTQQPWNDATLGLQLYGEWMRDSHNYRETLPEGFPVKDRVRKVTTLRFTQLFAHQTVTFNVFTFVGLSENDHYIIPSLRYAFSDNLWAEVGANVFGGNRNGTFGSLQDNRNVYLTVRLGI
jgi:hypothetical protein